MPSMLWSFRKKNIQSKYGMDVLRNVEIYLYLFTVCVNYFTNSKVSAYGEQLVFISFFLSDTQASVCLLGANRALLDFAFSECFP